MTEAKSTGFSKAKASMNVEGCSLAVSTDTGLMEQLEKQNGQNSDRVSL